MSATRARASIPSWAVRLLGVIAAALMAGGFVAPFLVGSDEEGGQSELRLLPAIGQLREAGDGPYEGEAALASIAVGLFAAVLALTIVGALLVAVVPRSQVVSAAAFWAAVVLLIGCLGAGILALMLGSLWEGSVLPLSPAAGLAFLGGALLCVAAVLGSLPAPAAEPVRSSSHDADRVV